MVEVGKKNVGETMVLTILKTMKKFSMLSLAIQLHSHEAGCLRNFCEALECYFRTTHFFHMSNNGSFPFEDSGEV